MGGGRLTKTAMESMWRDRLLSMDLRRRVAINEKLGNCMSGGIKLLLQNLVFFPILMHSLRVQLHLGPELLLRAPNICHPSEDEVEALHNLLPVSIILTRSMRHCVEHKLGLHGWLGGAVVTARKSIQAEKRKWIAIPPARLTKCGGITKSQRTKAQIKTDGILRNTNESESRNTDLEPRTRSDVPQLQPKWREENLCGRWRRNG